MALCKDKRQTAEQGYNGNTKYGDKARLVIVKWLDQIEEGVRVALWYSARLLT